MPLSLRVSISLRVHVYACGYVCVCVWVGGCARTSYGARRASLSSAHPLRTPTGGAGLVPPCHMCVCVSPCAGLYLSPCLCVCLWICGCGCGCVCASKKSPCQRMCACLFLTHTLSVSVHGDDLCDPLKPQTSLHSLCVCFLLLSPSLVTRTTYSHMHTHAPPAHTQLRGGCPQRPVHGPRQH